MTIAQFAVARAFKQLLELSTQRTLTVKEITRLPALEIVVQSYEAEENKRVEVSTRKYSAPVELPSTQPTDAEIERSTLEWLNNTRP